MNEALQDRYTQLSADADGWSAERHGNTRGSLCQQSRDEVPHNQEVPALARDYAKSLGLRLRKGLGRDYNDKPDDSEGWEDWYIV